MFPLGVPHHNKIDGGEVRDKARSDRMRIPEVAEADCFSKQKLNVEFYRIKHIHYTGHVPIIY